MLLPFAIVLFESNPKNKNKGSFEEKKREANCEVDKKGLMSAVVDGYP